MHRGMLPRERGSKAAAEDSRLAGTPGVHAHVADQTRIRVETLAQSASSGSSPHRPNRSARVPANTSPCRSSIG